METLKSLINFMIQQDYNGAWDELIAGTLTKNDCLYMEETLNNWIDEGLEVNNRIEGYLTYLNLIRWNQITLGGK